MPFIQTSLFYDLDNASRHWLVGSKVTYQVVAPLLSRVDPSRIPCLHNQKQLRYRPSTLNPHAVFRVALVSHNLYVMPSFENSSSAVSHMQQFVLPYNRHKPSRNHLLGTLGPLNHTSSLLRCQEKLAFPFGGWLADLIRSYDQSSYPIWINGFCNP